MARRTSRPRSSSPSRCSRGLRSACAGSFPSPCSRSSRSVGARRAQTAAASSWSRRAAPCSGCGSRLDASRCARSRWRRALAVGLGLALVGLDAATGGSSHVTRRVGDGPGALLGELGNRVHISVERLASSWHAALVFAISIAALVILATRRPRFAAGEALLVAIGVSLVVNDTPHHVAAAGAISYGVLWTFERLDSAPMRRLP